MNPATFVDANPLTPRTPDTIAEAFDSKSRRKALVRESRDGEKEKERDETTREDIGTETKGRGRYGERQDRQTYAQRRRKRERRRHTERQAGRQADRQTCRHAGRDQIARTARRLQRRCALVVLFRDTPTIRMHKTVDCCCRRAVLCWNGRLSMMYYGTQSSVLVGVGFPFFCGKPIDGLYVHTHVACCVAVCCFCSTQLKSCFFLALSLSLGLSVCCGIFISYR